MNRVSNVDTETLSMGILVWNKVLNVDTEAWSMGIVV